MNDDEKKIMLTRLTDLALRVNEAVNIGRARKHTFTIEAGKGFLTRIEDDKKKIESSKAQVEDIEKDINLISYYLKKVSELFKT